MRAVYVKLLFGAWACDVQRRVRVMPVHAAIGGKETHLFLHPVSQSGCRRFR